MSTRYKVHEGSAWSLYFEAGIFILNINQPIKGTPEQAWEWINMVLDLKKTIGRPYPLLTIVKQKVEFTSEGRGIMRLVENEEHFVAHAMWASSLAMKAMVKFLMVMVPRNLFDEDVFLKEANAHKWLREQIDKSKHAPISEEEVSRISIKINQTPRVI